MRIRVFKILSILSVFLFSFSSVSAFDSSDIVINEIAWMGTKIEGVESKNWWRDEWIELYNTTNQEIDISSWEIENAKASNETLEISVGKIAPLGYFLICRKEIGNCDLIESKLSFHNEYNKNGKLVLKDTLGSVIDSTPEAGDKQWPAGDNETKQTMERKDYLVSGNNPENWQTSKESGGTPKTENSSKSAEVGLPLAEDQEIKEKSEPISYPLGIVFNEILPSPEGSDAENEWIEIFNGNDFEVDVSDWKIRDTIGATTTYSFPEEIKIKANSFLIFPRPETKITLQNSGDGLELLNPSGEIVDKINYKKASLGQSFNRTLEGFVRSITLTPGEKNIVTTPKTLKTGLSEDFKEKEEQKTETSQKLTSFEKISSAKIGENLPKSSNPLIILLVALGIAISSAIVVLIIKKKTETEE